MSFIDAIKTCFQKYVNFNGRARRSEMWWFVLFNFVVSFIVGMIGNAMGTTVLATLWTLAVFLPGLAVEIRRLHDIGKKWTWILFALIPVVGTIILIVWFCKDSDPGDNEFGPNPKGM
ncbi:MAG: DUF805 domain-containing protein [Lachnospiraceae bacterium]|nr:DUF805 domain-containing protein [Lachnospiraceae bacterium]